MTTPSRIRPALRWASLGAGAAAGAYAMYVAAAWLRYGHAPRPAQGSEDALLDQYMAAYDVVERHRIRVHAPAEITFAAACDADLQESPVVRAIFRAREVILGSEPDKTIRPRGVLAYTKSIGWGVLAEVPGREVVMGAVTQPWEPDTRFRAVPPAAFAAFNEPGYVKIAWTLRADPIGPAESIFRTETRAVATDAAARAKFRRYWSFLSPGIIVIRWLMLQPVKTRAEAGTWAAGAAEAPRAGGQGNAGRRFPSGL